MLRTIIIDDEADARYNLRALLQSYCPTVGVIGEATGVEEACRLAASRQPDLLLLDISMQDGTGFDLLDLLRPFSFQVIFTTGHDDFAIKAFKYHALDYLLKPIGRAELQQAIGRVAPAPNPGHLQQLSGLLHSARHKAFDKIALPSMEGLVFLRVEDIIHLEADGNYTTFYSTKEKAVTVTRPIKEYEGLLPAHLFFRCHKSHIVNLNFIKRFLKEDGGVVQLGNGERVVVARRRKDGLLEALLNS